MKKKQLSRDDIAELYRDVQRSMSEMKPKSKASSKEGGNQAFVDELVKGIRAGMKADETRGAAATPRRPRGEEEIATVAPLSARTTPMGVNQGTRQAVLFLAVVLVAKVTVAAIEFSGAFSALPAEASIMTVDTSQLAMNSPGWSREEVALLKQLDARRVEIEKRRSALDAREEDLKRQEREHAVQLTELRELTERLRLERGKTDTKRQAQFDQLANVYSAMAPQEAAKLLEQLDVTVTLQLLQRMPEKRMGQILALMRPEKSLAVTNMMSGGNR